MQNIVRIIKYVSPCDYLENDKRIQVPEDEKKAFL